MSTCCDLTNFFEQNLNEIPTFFAGPSGLRDPMSFHVSPKSCRPRVQLWLPVPPHQATQCDQNGFFFCFFEKVYAFDVAAYNRLFSFFLGKKSYSADFYFFVEMFFEKPLRMDSSVFVRFYAFDVAAYNR